MSKGGGKGGSSNQRTTTSTMAEPWPGVQPFLTDAYGTAEQIYQGGPPGYYPGQTLGQQSPYTQSAIGLQAQRGLLGSPMVGAAQNGVGGIASGQNANAFAPAADAGNQAITGMLGGPMQDVLRGAAMSGVGGLLGNAQGFGVGQQLGGQASGSLAQQMAQGNPFGGPASMGLLGNSLGTLQTQGAANPLMGTTQNALSGIAGGRGVAGAAGPQGAARDAMTQSLRGDFLSAGNPYLEGAIGAATRPMVDNFQRTVVPGIQSAASAAGRYGSGAMSDALANAGTDLTRQIGDVGAQMSMANYGAERQNMLQNTGLALGDASGQVQQQLGALSQIAGLRGQDLGAIGQGAGLSGQLYGQGNAQQLAGINSAFNALGQQGGQTLAANQGLLGNFFSGQGQQLGAAQLGQQGFLNAERNQLGGAGLVPQLAAQDYIDIGAIGQSGAMQDQFNQAGINADVDRWNYNATAPMQWTSNYLGMLNGAPWGSMTQNSTNPQQQGGWRGILPIGGGILGGLVGGYFGGPMGAMAGSSAGSSLGTGIGQLF